MNSRNCHFHHIRDRFVRSDGVALVVVLGFIVLVTIVVLAFFSRVMTHREIVNISAGSIRTQQIAKVALGHVVDDLLAEMADGSQAVASPDGDVFFVNDAEKMMPERALASDLVSEPSAVNLVKQSKRDVEPFASALGLARASAVNTASAESSVNGRFLPPGRWSAPRLMTPGFVLSHAQTPDWIYVTRGGTTMPDFSAAARDKNPGNVDFILGRYAYQIYEIGGLLDANAFGSDPSSLSAELAGAKGSPLLVDLSAVPGLESMQDRSMLLSWRDKASGAPGPGRNSDSIALREIGGWDAPRVIDSGGTMDNDNYFVSRQDLIRVLENRIGATNAEKALPYLTHFAKTLNRPSHQPVDTRPRILYDAYQGGNTGKGSDDAINPGERSKTDGKLLVKNRFALAYLGLLTDPAANADRIHELFGLVRDGPGWTYDSSLLGPNGIRRLDQVIGRDPNFFEMLKAAIHVGSLGVAHGSTQAQSELAAAGLDYDALHPASLASWRDADANRHILRIGANLIDQYDRDSFPTRIEYDGETVTGVEAIPHFAAIMANYYAEREIVGVRPEGSSYSGDWQGPIESVMLLQPRLWNPYVSAEASPADQTPTRFRVRAEYAGPDPFIVTGHNVSNNPLPANSVWRNDRPEASPGFTGLANSQNYRWNYEPLGGRNFGPGQPDNPGTAFASQGGGYQFELPSGWNAVWPPPFSDPYTLFRNGYPSAGITISDPAGPVEFQTIQPGAFDGFNIGLNNITSMSAPYTVYGFPLGRLWRGPTVQLAGNNGGTPLCYVGYTFGGFVLITLSCEVDGNWIDYDTITANLWNWGGFIANNTGSGGSRAATIMKAATNGWIKFDPRSPRWGSLTAHVRAMRIYQDGEDRTQFWRRDEWREGRSLMRGATSEIEPDIIKQNETGAKDVWSIKTSAHVNSRSTPNQSADPSATAFNRSDTAYSYVDPDGIRRRGSGAHWMSGALAGQPMATGSNAEVEANRPVMLNRPFISVAEMGCAFRDTPWRNLDFFNEESGDAALLDFFCVYPTEDSDGEAVSPRNRDGTAIIGGRVNLNTPHRPVIEALLRGVYLNPNDQPLSTAAARDIAEDIVSFKAGESGHSRPFRDLSELVGYPKNATTYAGLAQRIGDLLPDTNSQRIEHQREGVVRALAGAGQTRTWNFLIDLIVQDGRLTPAATSLANFSISGEKRYWISVAIDRHSGEIVETQWEPVYE